MRFSCLIAFSLFSLYGCAPPNIDQSAVDSNSTTEGQPSVTHSEIPPTEADAVQSDPLSSAAGESAEALDDAPLDDAPLDDAPLGDATLDVRAIEIPSDLQPVRVMLGEDDLTAGIPGGGELTVAQIRTWLMNAENHRPIEPQLPQGIAGAAGNIQHLDANPLTRAKIELGRQLYFDPRLSSDGTISCASCHHPDEGYGKQTQFGVGVAGQQGNRNSPVSYNRILSGAQFWDGRAASLEEQAAGPIANPIEMGNTHEVALKSVGAIEGYRLQFDVIFPGEGINISTLTKAIASFERAIVTSTAPYDYYEQVRAIEKAYGEDIDELEDDDAELFADYQAALAGSAPMSESSKRGMDLFFSDRVGCTACHAGANFTDEKYHNLGVGMDAEEPDLGRFMITGKEEDKGAFKTPTCRNVISSAPYMHDGSQQTLEEVVEWYNKGGHPNPYLSDKVKKLNLTDQEKQDLVAFMQEGLTSDFPNVEQARLPR